MKNKIEVVIVIGIIIIIGCVAVVLITQQNNEKKATINNENNSNSIDLNQVEIINNDNEDEKRKTSISLDDFIGSYRGINPFYVTNWDTYEMSENADNSTLSFVKAGNGYMLCNIVLDSNSTNVHTNLESVAFNDNDMTYYLDDGQEDLWDGLSAENERGIFKFCKRRKDGQIVIGMTIDSYVTTFVKN